MTEWHIVYAELKAFDDRRAVVAAMRKGIRVPVPQIRKVIKGRAVATLPHRGGLGAWVASSRVNAAIKVQRRGVQMKLRGGRNSAGGRSDIDAIDRGRVRAPSWGRKTAAAWHTQSVTPGFFTKPAQEAADQVLGAIDKSVDQALDTLRG